jgi:integrase/recombinase XerD
LPYVPSEDEVQRYYQAVWQTRKLADLVLIKTLLYTGVRVSELVRIRLEDVDFDRCQIRINEGKGRKDRVVPFPPSFKETLALHAHRLRQLRVRVLVEEALQQSRRAPAPAALCHGRRPGAPDLAAPPAALLLTWLKKQGIDDALIQPYSGHGVGNRSRSAPVWLSARARLPTTKSSAASRSSLRTPLLCGLVSRSLTPGRIGAVRAHCHACHGFGLPSIRAPTAVVGWSCAEWMASK